MTSCSSPPRPARNRPVRPAPPATRPRGTLTAYGCAPDEAALFADLAPAHRVALVTVEAQIDPDNAVLARGGRWVSVGHRSPVTDRTLRALSEIGVRHVSTRSVGCNHIDVDYAEQVGIRVQTVAYSPDSVADHTVMLMLMALRSAKHLLRRVDAHDYRLPTTRGRELRDLTVGVVGTGRIGAAVVRRLRGFGVRPLAWDAHRTVAADHLPLDELLRRSDVVSLHVPLTADTHHLLDRRRIDGLRPGAIVVNTARGGLLDTDALLAAIESGRLGGAALDVVEGEEGIFYADHSGTAADDGPHGPSLARLDRLRRSPNVIVSPHTAYYTDHALRDTVDNTLLACLADDRDPREASACAG